MKNITKAIFLALALLGGEAGAAVCTSVKGTPATPAIWDSSATWDCGKVPGANDSVTIASPHTVSLGKASRSASSLTIDAGATLDDNGRDLTVSGSVAINGTYDGTGNNGNLIMTGNGQTLSGTGTVIDIGRIQIDGSITIPAGSNLNLTLDSEIRVGNNSPATLTINGTIDGAAQTAGNRIIRVDNNNTASVIINGAVNAPNSFAEIQGSGTVTNNGTVTLGYLDGNRDKGVTWTQGTNSSLTFSQPAKGWTGTFDASATGNTVTFNGTATPIGPATYYNIAGAGVTCPHPAGVTVLGTSPCTPYPSVSSINLASPNPTTPATVVSWTVVFSESVTGVDAGDFALVPGGGVTGASITGVTGSGTTWTVTANTGSGTGTLGLNLVDDDTIANGSGRKLGGTGAGNGNFTGQVYIVELPMTCVTDDFAAGVLDTTLWNVRTISGAFTPQVVDAGGGDFRLRLTDTGLNEATFAQLKRTFPGAGNKVILEIDYFAYGGTGADGIAVTFSDSAISSTTGGFGGSLGYANRTGVDGFGGGWLGIGLDEYGNFPNPTEGRLGYPTGWVAPVPANVAAGFYTTNVSVRGSGSAQTGYRLLANTGVLATAVNPPSGAAGATPYRYRFTIDHGNGVNAWVTVERDDTAPLGDSYTTLIPTFDVKGANSGQVAVPPSWLISFTGSTGGSTNFHEFKRVRVCANTIAAAGGPHHLEIQHASGTGVTCSPSTLTVKACADGLNPCTPYTGGVNGTLSATGTGMTVNWSGGTGFSIAAGSSTVTKDVQVTTAGTVTFDAASTPAATAATTCSFGTPSCTFTAADSGFLVSAPNHAAETLSALTVKAVKKADNSLQCVPAFGNASKVVNLKCTYTNPATGTLPVRVGGFALNAAGDANAACDGSGKSLTLSFDANGVATPTLQYADAGEMSVTATHTGTTGAMDAGLVMTGTGSFIAAPASFSFSGITAGPIRAGNPFSATVTALNAAGNATPNFGKESSPEGVTLGSTLVIPDPAVHPTASNPALGNNVIAGGEFGAGGMVSDANGVATVNNLSWSEVGSITLDAALTSVSYLGSGLGATGTSATVGAFIPDHFDTAVAATATIPMPCPAGSACPASFNGVLDGFVYSGQPFSVQVTARNLANGTTLNYDGTFGLSNDAALAVWDASGSTTTQNPGPGALANNTVAAAAFAAGVGTTVTPTYTFAAPITAPANVFVRAGNADATSLRAIPGNSVEGGVMVASGRIRIGSAHGSELLPLPMTATVQYYNGTNWVTSATDNATQFDTGLSTAGGNLVATIIKGPLVAVAVAGPASATVSGGAHIFTLARPGVAGAADVSLNAPAWLPSNAARATFGVYKGNNEFIYLRENY